MAVNGYLKEVKGYLTNSNSRVEVRGNEGFTTFSIYLDTETDWLSGMVRIKKIIGDKKYLTMVYKNKNEFECVVIVVHGLNANELKNEII